MGNERWFKSWAEGQTRFHRSAVHADLTSYEQQFLGDTPRRVLVPLCGKTLDIPWMVERHHEVVGVELVGQAVDEFHREQNLSPRAADEEPFKAFYSERLKVLCGDVFELEAEHVGAVDRIWDRAALVALDEPTRARYVDKLRSITNGAAVMLNAFEYDQTRMDGPPYSVPDDEVRRLYDGASIEVLARNDTVDQVPFQDAGHEYFYVTTYLIQL